MKLYSDEGRSSHHFERLYLFNPGIVNIARNFLLAIDCDSRNTYFGLESSTL